MSRSKRLFYIFLTVLITLIVGYFIFAATQVESPELSETEDVGETAGAE